ncbi:hypothetical protein ACX40Y_04025 [Sphingomonas sp. RS6]
MNIASSPDRLCSGQQRMNDRDVSTPGGVIEYFDLYMDQSGDDIARAARFVSASSTMLAISAERTNRSCPSSGTVPCGASLSSCSIRESRSKPMTDKQPIQANGDDGKKGARDGVSEAGTHGRSAGESQGGAYPNPYPDKARRHAPGDFMGHGGQTHINYEGGDNPNATTEDED